MSEGKTPEQEHQERVDEDVAEFSRQWWEDHDRATDLQSRASQIVALLKALPTDDARLEVLSNFCSHCGRFDGDDIRGCQCWNDE